MEPRSPHTNVEFQCDDEIGIPVKPSRQSIPHTASAATGTHAPHSTNKTHCCGRTAIKKAATFYRSKVARHGGYVYFYSVDLQRRFGEGVASLDQNWVQPPGTPTVGMAYLKAFNATGDRYYLDAATETADALIYGQLKSGAWTNCIDFDPRGQRVSLYRNGKGRGRKRSFVLVSGIRRDSQTESVPSRVRLAEANGSMTKWPS
jgi:hypothetical protein